MEKMTANRLSVYAQSVNNMGKKKLNETSDSADVEPVKRSPGAGGGCLR